MEDPELTSVDLLFDAVHRDRLHDVLMLLKSEDTDVNTSNSHHKTLLCIALENQNVVLVNHLLDHGADLNGHSYCSTYSTFETPLVTAARMQNLELVDLLMERGCLPSTGRNSVKDGKTAMQWAATHGNITMAERMLRLGEDVNWSGPYFHTALSYAVLADQPAMVTWLLNHGATNCVNGDGRTPLHLATARGHSECAYILISAGYSIYQQDNHSFSPFYLTCYKGHCDMLNFMLRSVLPCEMFQTFVDEGLRGASSNGHVDVMRVLLGQKANVNAVNTYGETAISIAARGQNEAVQLLLDSGAVINNTDKRGYMPLQHAIQRSHMDIALTLIYHGADIHTKDERVESPLKLAVNTSSPLLVNYLLETGCDLRREPWFKDKIVEEKMCEVDYKYPRNYHINSLQSRHKELWQAVLDKMHRPPTLMEASRISIRAGLSSAAQGKTIVNSIRHLPMPTALLRYITVDHIDI